MELFRRALETVFNNWSALEIAVNQSGARDSTQIILGMIDTVMKTVFRGEGAEGIAYGGSGGNFDEDELACYLADSLDDNFNTICEDDSPEEIVEVVKKLFHCIAIGDDPFQIPEMQRLSTTKNWIPFPTNPPSCELQDSMYGRTPCDKGMPGPSTSYNRAQTTAYDVENCIAEADRLIASGVSATILIGGKDQPLFVEMGEAINEEEEVEEEEEKEEETFSVFVPSGKSGARKKKKNFTPFRYTEILTRGSLDSSIKLCDVEMLEAECQVESQVEGKVENQVEDGESDEWQNVQTRKRK